MCGIAGLSRRSVDSKDLRSALEAMCATLVHRGPDDEGYYLNDEIGLGMRRLSVIDIEGGQQPISNEEDSVHVVFNGEIYNHRSLRRRLAEKGHKFSSQSDTEVLVHLFEEKGLGLLDELQGMFAFAIWDDRKRELVLARDRLGIKPLYYAASSDEIAFASELGALRSVVASASELDRGGLARYLALGYIPAPYSIYDNVRKLRPGQFLTWSQSDGVDIRRYWSPAQQEVSIRDESEAVARLRELLFDSVRKRLLADVPLGAFLSGGLDSSAVVACMARAMDQPVKTFSIGFQEGEYNEAPYAREVAEALGTDHAELTVTPEAGDLFESLVARFDEPFADSSALPTYLVSKLARRDVKVCLSGDGGDELFGGYERYCNWVSRDFKVPGLLRKSLGFVARKLPHAAYGRNRLLELSRTRRGRYAGMVADSLLPTEGGVARPELASRGADLDHLLDEWFEETGTRDFLTQIMMVDSLSYLPGDILTKLDRMSMAVSLEARVPLLDHRLVEFAFSLPSTLKLRNGRGKWILRQAVRDMLPDTVFTRPKQGFAVPLRRWFRNELRDRCAGLAATNSGLYEFVDDRAVSRLLREHQSGRRDHSRMIWKLLVLDYWLDA